MADIVRNNKRKVTITSNDTSVTDSSWKYNLKNILSGSGSSSGVDGEAVSNILNSSIVANQFNVEPQVELLLENFPKIRTGEEKPDQPVVDFLSGNSQYLSKDVNNFIANTYSKIGGIANIGMTVSGALSGDSGVYNQWYPWVSLIKTWNMENLKGLSFSVDFNFSMGQYGLWNAKKEVVLPILNLVAPAIPRMLNSWSAQGPFQSTLQMLSNLLIGTVKSVGTTITDIMGGLKEEGLSSITDKVSSWDFSSVGSALQEFIMKSSGYLNYTYDVKFGDFVEISNCLIESASAEWASETDQYGYPIKGKATLNLSTITPLTLQQSSADIRAIRFGV